jgi:hypothetical protein
LHYSFSNLLQVREKLGLSYSNIRGLHQIIDQIPERAVSIGFSGIFQRKGKINMYGGLPAALSELVLLHLGYGNGSITKRAIHNVESATQPVVFDDRHFPVGQRGLPVNGL